MVDSLAMVGEKLEQGDIILIVLGGLGLEYDTFVTSITTHFDPLTTFVDLHALLLDQELRLSAMPGATPPTVKAIIVVDKSCSLDGKFALC